MTSVFGLLIGMYFVSMIAALVCGMIALNTVPEKQKLTCFKWGVIVSVCLILLPPIVFLPLSMTFIIGCVAIFMVEKKIEFAMCLVLMVIFSVAGFYAFYQYAEAAASV